MHHYKLHSVWASLTHTQPTSFRSSVGGSDDHHPLSPPITQMWASASLPLTNPSFLSYSFLSVLLVWTQKDSGLSNAIVWDSYVRVIKAYTVSVL